MTILKRTPLVGQVWHVQLPCDVQKNNYHRCLVMGKIDRKYENGTLFHDYLVIPFTTKPNALFLEDHPYPIIYQNMPKGTPGNKIAVNAWFKADETHIVKSNQFAPNGYITTLEPDNFGVCLSAYIYFQEITSATLIRIWEHMKSSNPVKK